MIYESKKGGFTKITQPQVEPHLEPCKGDQSPCLRRGLGVGQTCKCGQSPQHMLKEARRLNK